MHKRTQKIILKDGERIEIRKEVEIFLALGVIMINYLKKVINNEKIKIEKIFICMNEDPLLIEYKNTTIEGIAIPGGILIVNSEDDGDYLELDPEWLLDPANNCFFNGQCSEMHCKIENYCPYKK